MGCCFSKELSSDSDNEKIGLLQKSVEEKKPENKISKTLSSLFDTLEGEELHSVENGPSRAAAGVTVWTRVFTRSGHRQDHRSKQSLNSDFSSTFEFFHGSENLDDGDKNLDTVVIEENSEIVSDPLCMSSDGQACSEDDQPFSHVPMPSDQQEETCVSDHLQCYPATCKNSLIDKEKVLNVQISSFNENNSVDVSAGELQNKSLFCVGDKHCKNSRESKFYSICAIDPESLNMEEELYTPMYGAAVEECHSAVTYEVFQVDCPVDSREECAASNTVQRAGELKLQDEELLPQDNLCSCETKEAFSEKSECSLAILVDCEPSDEAHISDLQAESLRAKVYAKFPKDHTEHSTLHNTGLLPELNINIGSDSLKCPRAVSEERENSASGIGSQVDDSLVNLLNDISYVGGNGEPEAITVSAGQSLNSKIEREDVSEMLLENNDYFHISVNSPGRILSFGLDKINLSPKRLVSESLVNECLPVHANLREVTLSKPDGPNPVPHRESVQMKEQNLRDSSLETKSIQLANRGEMFLCSENGSTYQDEDRMSILETESLGNRELKCWYQADLYVGSRTEKVHTETCNLTQVECEPDTEGMVQKTDLLKLGLSQNMPSDKSYDHSRPLQGPETPPAFIFTCTDTEARETALRNNTGDEVHVKSLVGAVHDQSSGPYALEKTEKEQQKANYREISEEDIENAKSDAKTILQWETSVPKCKVVLSGSTVTCIGSNVATDPDCETNQIENSYKTDGVNEYPDRTVVPPLNHSPVSHEAEWANSDRSPELHFIKSESVKEASSGFGNNASELSKQKLTCKEEKETLCLDKDSIDPNSIDCLSPCQTKRRNAKSTLKESTLNGEMHFSKNSEVTFKKMALCSPSEGYSSFFDVDCIQVDIPTAIPGDTLQAIPAIPADSKECAVPSGDYVTSPTQNILNVSENSSEMDWHRIPEEFYIRCLNKFSYYPTAGLASQALSEELAGGCGRYQVGFLWANTATENMTEDTQMFSENLHNKLPYLGNTSFSLEQTPYPLPVSEDGVVWGWQNRGGQLVSMMCRCLLCRALAVFTRLCL